MQRPPRWTISGFVGLGFFALAPVQGLYDTYMPAFLTEFLSSSLLIGLLMGVDNLLGMILLPYFGALSDRFESRFGKRLPFILLGVPLTAVGMLALPFGREQGLPFLMLASLLMNCSITICRPALLALLADSTPAQQRPVAFGLTVTLLGLGNLVGLGVGQWLYTTNQRMPFLFSGTLMLVSFVIFVLFLREPKQREGDAQTEEVPQRLRQVLYEVVANPDRTILFLFLSLLLLFMTILSLTTWFTVYGVERFQQPVNIVSRGMLTMVVTWLVFGMPSGLIGRKLGRRRSVVLGLGGMVASLLFLYAASSLTLAIVGMGLFGIAIPLVIVNIYPMVLTLAPPRQVGTYTGLYFMCQSSAGILGPLLLGLVFDLAGSRQPLFLVLTLFALLSLVLLTK